MKVIQTKTENHTSLVKHWTDNVHVDQNTIDQAVTISKLPFIHKHIALMPDCHLGKGATVGSVIATKKAIVPAAVGVDIGCGMIAVQTSLVAKDLSDSLKDVRNWIEEKIPVGRNSHTDSQVKKIHTARWHTIRDTYSDIVHEFPKIMTKKHPINQLGTLGGGNHFIEICLDEKDNVWIMLHSGSRGIGNRIGKFFIEKAKEEMSDFHIRLEHTDLSYLSDKSKYFKSYWRALEWSQTYARHNRDVMLESIIRILSDKFKGFRLKEKAINCHHNYVSIENHFGENVYVTRKGAIRARKDDLGIIPGSMGTKSFIVQGKGNLQSFQSCSHGAGRTMSRTKAKESISLDEHIKDTEGVECKKDISVLDETPKAYKDIDAVMKAQDELVGIKHTLKQILCIKG